MIPVLVKTAKIGRWSVLHVVGQSGAWDHLLID